MKFMCIWLAVFVIMGMTLYSVMSNKSAGKTRWRKIKISVRSVLSEIKKSRNHRIRRDRRETDIADSNRSTHFPIMKSRNHRIRRDRRETDIADSNRSAHFPIMKSRNHQIRRDRQETNIADGRRSTHFTIMKSGNHRVGRDRRETDITDNRRSTHFTNKLERKVKNIVEQYKRDFSTRIENVSRKGKITNGGCKKWKGRHKKVRKSLPVQVVAAMTFWKYFQWAMAVEKRCIEENELTKNFIFIVRFDEISNRIEEWLDWENDSLTAKNYKKKIPILIPPAIDVKSYSNYVTYLTHEILQNFVSFLNCFNSNTTSNPCVIWSRCRKSKRKDRKNRKHRRRKGKKEKSEIGKDHKHKGKKEKKKISNGRKHRGKKVKTNISNDRRDRGKKEQTKISNDRRDRGEKEETKISNDRKRRVKKKHTQKRTDRRHRGEKKTQK